GPHTVKIRVNDTLGNTNTTTRTFQVIDVKLPIPCPGTTPEFEAALLRFGDRVQEEGGPVWVEACVQDETPVNMTARLTHTSGEVREYPMHPTGPNTYNATFSAQGQGRHDVAVVAEDRDGNEARAGHFTLFVEPAAPPTVSGLVPGPGAWANATPAMSATFADMNLDRATIRMDVREGDEPFERATPLMQGVPDAIVGTIVGRTYDHGDVVQVRASANDTLGHATTPVEWSFRVDTRPPGLNLTLVGERAPGAVASFVTREAGLDAAAADTDSGLSHLEVKWTNADQKLETPWTTVTDDIRLVDPQVDRGAGLYEVRVRSLDRVGNVGVVPEVRFVLDPDPPVVTLTILGDALDVDLVDAGAGLRSLVVGARLLGDPTFQIHDLTDETRRQPQGGKFAVTIPVVSKGETLEYYVVAEDLLGNRLALGSTLEPQRYTGINHAPRLVVDAPANDTEVRGPVDLAWTAVDDDLDSVRVDLEVRPVVLSDGEILAQRAAPRGAAAWDTRRTPDGIWILTFTARDQESETVIERRVLVNNTGTGLGAVLAPGGRIEYLDEVRFEVTLYRPVVAARLVVHDDKDRVVAEHELHDDGARGDRAAGDGVYTALYKAAEKGEYRTDIEVVYADAGTVVMKGAGVYSVKSSFGASFERNLLWVLLGGALLVGIGAFVVVQLMRYGYI
ncbi:MAG TPA: choice-of-anchor X domain-containing protein, partial [Candidatus Thermoplasmatota archaeon]|nr:choice-of-anchor X domain-containing protein [Candidatus Thermoplasmatota archaeon]